MSTEECVCTRSHASRSHSDTLADPLCSGTTWARAGGLLLVLPDAQHLRDDRATCGHAGPFLSFVTGECPCWAELQAAWTEHPWSARGTGAPVVIKGTGGGNGGAWDSGYS